MPRVKKERPPKKPIEIMSYKKEGNIIFASTSSSSKPITRTVYINLEDGTGTCTCEEYFFKHNQCPHIKAVYAKYIEEEI